jgi:hypothetical protein
MGMLIVGSLAAALVFSSFFMRRMATLRMAAIASNIAFVSYALLGVAYGVFARLLPILVLHASLLPLNVIRLRELGRTTRGAAPHEPGRRPGHGRSRPRCGRPRSAAARLAVVVVRRPDGLRGSS